MIRVLSTEIGALKFNKAQNTLEGRIRLNYRSDTENGLYTAEIGTSVPVEKGVALAELEEALVAKALDYLCLGPHKVARNTVNIFGELRNREEARHDGRKPAPQRNTLSGLFGLRGIALRVASDRAVPEHA